MIGNYRSFDVGPDPFGRTWSVVFLWQQNGISIRHADTVDCKFRLTQGGESQEKVIALPHPALLEVTKELGRPLTDAWCMKQAALHLTSQIMSDTDMEKELVTLTADDLRKYAPTIDPAPAFTT